MTLLVWRGREVSPLFILQVALVLVAFGLIIYFQNDFIPSSKSEKIMANAELIGHVTLGFNMMICDDLWIRLLQDIDFKEGQKVDKGWVFHMVDAITTLDRRFRYAYAAGATLMSVLVRDQEGARIIFERALVNFPKDWSMAYRAGYHYLYEVKNCKRAAELLKLASENGAPTWVAGLSGRLYAKSGQYELARSVIVDTLERNKGTKYTEQLEKRLAQLDEHYKNSKNTTFIDGLNCNGP